VAIQEPKRRHALVFAASVALCTLVTDQFTKWLVTVTLAPGDRRDIMHGMVSWIFIKNLRGAYGLFGDQRWLLAIMAVSVLGLFAYGFRDLVARSRSAAWLRLYSGRRARQHRRSGALRIRGRLHFVTAISGVRSV